MNFKKMHVFQVPDVDYNAICTEEPIPSKPMMHFPLFRKFFYFPPYFGKFPSDFVEFTCFLHTLRAFRFTLLLPRCIYASHNAPTGRPWISIMPDAQSDSVKCKLLSLSPPPPPPHHQQDIKSLRLFLFREH